MMDSSASPSLWQSGRVRRSSLINSTHAGLSRTFTCAFSVGMVLFFGCGVQFLLTPLDFNYRRGVIRQQGNF